MNTIEKDTENEHFSVGLFPMVGDLLHVGHLDALRKAKMHCDHLIVALNCDPTVDNHRKNKPVETVYERWMRLMSTTFVDDVIPYCGESDLLRVLATIPYDVRFIGSDHESWTGDKYEERHHIPYIKIIREHDESTSALRARVCEAEKKARKKRCRKM